MPEVPSLCSFICCFAFFNLYIKLNSSCDDRTNDIACKHKADNNVEFTRFLDSVYVLRFSHNFLFSLETVQFEPSVRLLTANNNSKKADVFTVVCHVDHFLQGYSCGVLWSKKKLSFLASNLNFIVKELQDLLTLSGNNSRKMSNTVAKYVFKHTHHSMHVWQEPSVLTQPLCYKYSTDSTRNNCNAKKQQVFKLNQPQMFAQVLLISFIASAVQISQFRASMNIVQLGY